MTNDEPRNDRFSEWLVAAQMNVAILLGVLALLWAVPAVYFAPTVLGGAAVETKSDSKDKDANADPTIDKSPDKEKPNVFDPNRANKTIAFALGVVGVVSCGIFAIIWIGGYPTLPAHKRHAQARVYILGAAALTGFLLMVGGAWFTTDQFELIKKWLDTKSSKNLWKVLTPILVFVIGAAIAFAGAHFARADERHNQTARRLVYATHFGVTTMLLFVLLVIANVFFGAKLPNKLDTTSASTFTLHPSTEKYIRELNQKVTVYSYISPRMDSAPALRVLLNNCQEVNPKNFVVQQLNGTTDMPKIQAKFPAVNWNETALLIALGDDESRFGSIKDIDLEKSVGQGPQRFFQGEVQLMKELLFLSENKVKPTVYFTQGNGELAIDATPESNVSPERSATMLKAQLEAANVNVQALKFDKKNPKIPADASAIVVLDPTTTMPEELIGALRAYMTDKNAAGKSGRLIVATSPHPNIKGDGIQLTGLEPLLAEFNVGVVSAYLYTYGQDLDTPEDAVAIGSRQATNPVGQLFANRRFLLPGPHRPINLSQQRNQAFRAIPLLVTEPTNFRASWLEKTKPADLDATLKALAKSPELQAEKMLGAESRILATTVTEGETGRLIVFGSGSLFNDGAAPQQRRSAMTIGGRILQASVDWLRDRPDVEVVNKEIGYWKVPTNFDLTTGMFLPFGLMLLTISLVAIGVWVVRRR